MPSCTLLFVAIFGLSMGLTAGCEDSQKKNNTDAGTNTDSETGSEQSDDQDWGDGPVGGISATEITVDNISDEYQSSVWVWGIFDRPVPDAEYGTSWEYWSETLAEEGDCALVETAPGLGNCDPPCEDDEICSSANTCLPGREYRPAGALTFSGLNIPVAIEPNELGWYSLTEVPPDDLFEPTSEISVAAAGGQTPAFQVSTSAVSPLEPALDCDMEIVAGQDLTITWTPGNDGALIRWEIVSCYHAGNGPIVICETADDGELTVPSNIIDAYLPHQTAAETLWLTRFRRAVSEIDKGYTVSLEVASQRVCW